MEENKNKSVLPIIIFFGLLFGVVIFLPNLKKYLNDAKVVSVSSEKKKVDKKEEQPVKTDLIYDFNAEIALTEDGITVNNFDVSNGLSFTLTNGRTTILNNNEKFYLELYDQNNLLLKRIMLYFEKPVSPNEKINFNFDLINFKRISFVKKDINDYPYVDKVVNENNMIELTCTGKSDSYIYYFNKDQELIKTKYTLTKNKTEDIAYLDQVIEYKNKAITLDTKDGIDATFQETLTNFDFLVIYDLKEVKYDEIKSNTLYPLNSKLKVVSFEMSSQDYICK